MLQTASATGVPVDLDTVAAQTFSSTVCIVGAGIAGLVLAMRLAEEGVQVHLLEAGGLEQEDRSQAFYQTEQPADLHTGAHDGRFRTFGGSSTRWGGQLLPFTPDIFAPAAGCPSRPWPIASEDIEPHYEAIRELFQVDDLPFDAALLPALGHAAVPFSPGFALRFSKWAPFHRRNLARTLGPQALRHPGITVFTHANVAALAGDTACITHAHALNYGGDEFRFEARHFVVATGTIESSRLLLLSPGVPNPHDQTGRFFNDHLSFQAGSYTIAARQPMLRALGPFFVDGTLHTCKIEASADTRARENLLACMAHVTVQEPEDSGTAAIRNLLRSVQRGDLKQAVSSNLLPMLRGAGDVFRLLYQARIQRRRAVSTRAQVWLNIDVEQAPDPENRIRLSAERDALGLPKALVDWRVNPPEQETAVREAQLVRPELERLGLAPSAWNPGVGFETAGAEHPPPMVDTYHSMGGLCMGTDPAHSVVDPQLRVHGLENLHVASCAVFPSGSSSNPTFTLIALTLRLARHLANQLKP
jgi:choline dehydrogenase-like flavoprotein